MKVAIIGGGAAGFFSALSVKEHHPKSKVVLFEKTSKLLSKVKISGGGRCNVTNGTHSISELSKAYPRGQRQLKKLFLVFNTRHCYEWFENRGVPLMTQEDNCVFPVSQDSQSVIDCFLREARKHDIEIRTKSPIVKLKPSENFQIKLGLKDNTEMGFDKVIVSTGGSPKRSGLEWLEELGHEIVDPVPSLFTFNMPHESITDLMGIVVEETITSVQGTELKSDGPLLITHWGMSGPSILKLSAFGARELANKNYEFIVQVNWVNQQNNEVVRDAIRKIIGENPQKILSNFRPYGLPDRLWSYLLERSGLPKNKKWEELGKKGVNKLVAFLTNDIYQVKGKTTFKEEFVTCGGVSLKSINMKTMESRVVKNLYFAGEVIDIDGITGGYNFQAAWTTAYVAGKLH